MKIYTKTGDKGETGLMGGKRVGKDSLRIAAYGEIDELNVVLGLCRIYNKEASASDGSNQKLDKMLHHLQRDLLALGSDLATPLDEKHTVPRITTAQINQLEQWIDEVELDLEPLKNFILPGGGLVAAELHLARTICRRAERTIMALSKKEELNEQISPYINRLSDLFFVLARWANKLEGRADEKWIS